MLLDMKCTSCSRPYEEDLVEEERQAHPGALVLPRARVSWIVLEYSTSQDAV